MEAVATTPSSSGAPLTQADLERLPDDGHRYELIDAVLIVSPAPGHLHQRAAYRIARMLDDNCPDELEMIMAPFTVILADDTVMQPDVLVARRADITPKDLPTAPVLAVEILSPSTRRFDLMLKRSRFEAAGVQAYWVIDPDEPSVTAWNLEGGAFHPGGQASGDEVFVAEIPFALKIIPSRLVSG